MALRPLSERTRLALISADEMRRSAVTRVMRSPLVRWRYSGAEAQQLLIVPGDLRTGDPSFAGEVLGGDFSLAGAVARVYGMSPFAVRPPSRAWERELHGFAWLRDLRAAAGDPDVREMARLLVADWIERCPQQRSVAWEADVVARRVMSWLANGPLLLEATDARHYERIMRSLDQQVQFLAASYRDAPQGLPRLATVTALLYAGLCIAEQSRFIGAGLPAFGREIDRQILPDGGHASRNPAALIEILHDLLPLRQCFVARRLPVPERLATAIRRMVPMLRYLRLGDGGLARFNGAGPTPAHDVATLLAYGEAQATTPAHDRASRYVRLARGETIILVDAGPAPPLQLSGDAHAGCLSFEMSSGIVPLVVNCGAPGSAYAQHRTAARSTIAHSTLSIGEVPSAQFITGSNLERRHDIAPLRGPGEVAVRTAERDRALELVASHDGYLERLGLVHERWLRLDGGGLQLAGRDRLTAPGGPVVGREGRPFAVRFHLHPSAECRTAGAGNAAEILLVNGERWQLKVRDARPSVEDSLFLADHAGPRTSTQIVIRGMCRDTVEINWSLARVGPPPGRA